MINCFKSNLSSCPRGDQGRLTCLHGSSIVHAAWYSMLARIASSKGNPTSLLVSGMKSLFWPWWSDVGHRGLVLNPALGFSPGPGCSAASDSCSRSSSTSHSPAPLPSSHSLEHTTRWCVETNTLHIISYIVYPIFGPLWREQSRSSWSFLSCGYKRVLVIGIWWIYVYLHFSM